MSIAIDPLSMRHSRVQRKNHAPYLYQPTIYRNLNSLAEVQSSRFPWKTTAVAVSKEQGCPMRAAVSVQNELCLSKYICASPVSLRQLCQQVDVNSSKTAVVQPAMPSIRGRELLGASKPWHQQLRAIHTTDSCYFSPIYADQPVKM